MPDDVVVGRITGWFGVRGEVKLSAADADAIRVGLALRLVPQRGVELRTVLDAIRPHGGAFVARLRDCTDAQTARSLTGATIWAARAELPVLPAGAYRAVDLVGMRVSDARLGPLGNVRAVRRYPSCDMLVVGGEGLLVPMLRAYGVEVDATARTIRLSLPDGFEDLI